MLLDIILFSQSIQLANEIDARYLSCNIYYSFVKRIEFIWVQMPFNYHKINLFSNNNPDFGFKKEKTINS